MSNFLQILGLVWLILMSISLILFFAGILIEKKLKENHPIKKWWRKNIVAPDPYDNPWKNFNG